MLLPEAGGTVVRGIGGNSNGLSFSATMSSRGGVRTEAS